MLIKSSQTSPQHTHNYTSTALSPTVNYDSVSLATEGFTYQEVYAIGAIGLTREQVDESSFQF